MHGPNSPFYGYSGYSADIMTPGAGLQKDKKGQKRQKRLKERKQRKGKKDLK